jgi:hypothetical protein
MPASSMPEPKSIEVVPIAPPAVRVRRDATFAAPGEKKTRYHLPTALATASPVGYRERVSLSREEAEQALRLLSMRRPTRFMPPTTAVREQELFEEVSLGVLTARQSTNYQGHRTTLLGPQDSARLTALLRRLDGVEAAPLEQAAYSHIVLSRPYRTPFTFLLTFIGHWPIISPWSVALRAAQKKLRHADDIPTIGYLQQLHIGILADAMERAAVIASGGTRRAQVFMAPLCGALRERNRAKLAEIEQLAGLTAADRSQGWRVAIVAQVGFATAEERIPGEPAAWRKIGANLMAMRSERIQPGVNNEESAPAAYQARQDMDVPEALTVQCGRAAYNAFTHWTHVERERSKDLLLMERIDVLTPGGKERLRDIRTSLGAITDKLVKNIPIWADLGTARALTRNAARGKKAFALAGQRIYVGGLDPQRCARDEIDWTLGVRAFGAAAARSALVAELMGCVELPDDCDLLAGVCLMAGPVNQNDIGKTFYGGEDLLARAFPDAEPTSLLVWTLKAKTVADPIGNEEQLMNPAQRGALVELRPGPHEVVRVLRLGKLEAMRARDGRTNEERAFSDLDNFVTDPQGRHIPGNCGAPWPKVWSHAPIW